MVLRFIRVGTGLRCFMLLFNVLEHPAQEIGFFEGGYPACVVYAGVFGVLGFGSD